MFEERTGQWSFADEPRGVQSAGTGWNRGSADFLEREETADLLWDPAEELTFMLQNAMENGDELRARIPAARQEDSVTRPAPGTPMSNLQEITAELPPLQHGSARHRRRRERPRGLSIRIISLSITGMVAAMASAVSLFGGMVAYSPLQLSASSRMSQGMIAWWPLLVYGPWLVAALSILRAAVHQRRAVHSWCIVLLFSATALLMCLLQSRQSLTSNVAAALPSIASLACFQQLVRQITLTRPPRRVPPRHRQRPPATETPIDGLQ
ncbi:MULTISPECIES: DUF2637 domain-containing protein [Streptomyces]|uniref:DUF2637 domain-containing protein n=2 Tax=Streptomyces TaxID=1883 RepID=A0A2U9NVS9_STRAS|nr:DUF2637 domain-containing protein [Streptomyces actuosus]AWT40935.1 hypothetical protein DMT42_00270 [Streptomyces actuosus]MBM4826597.1 DUF2637 domain-containing protein [Streptomyces actuosus]